MGCRALESPSRKRCGEAMIRSFVAHMIEMHIGAASVIAVGGNGCMDWSFMGKPEQWSGHLMESFFFW